MNKIKNFFLSELEALKSGVTKAEYLSWWAVRFALVGVIIYLRVTDPDNINILLVSMNVLASFTVPLARIIFSPIKLIKKLTFRTQTILNIIILLGSGCGQGLGFYHKFQSYDKFLHVLAGAVVVLIGHELLNVFMRKGDRMSPLMKTFASASFSYAAMVIWEIAEFFSDYYWPGSINQAYTSVPEPDMIFFKIFGLGAQNEGQFAVFDTDLDLLCATIGNIFMAIILAIVLQKKENKQNKLTQSEEKEKITV